MKPLRKIIVLGGGTAGWISAALLANQLSKDKCKIELIESEQLGTIGVGESTVPPFMNLLAALGIDEADFIRKTQASFKLGIKFSDWYQKGKSFFHPFGRITAGLDESSLYQYWLRCVLSGERINFQDMSPCTVMAKNRRYVPYTAVERTPLAESRHALHLDASLTAKYLREYAEQKGVQRREGKVVDVVTQGEERIQALVLENGKKLEADFFIDCSGFRALLLGEALKVDYVDWSEYLPCNRAVTVMSEHMDEMPPYTKATAKDAGWVWRIPLQQRTGNGYVYVSEYCSDDEATATLLESVQGETMNEPRIIPFQTGIRKQFWKGNCIGVGLAAGFIEPLESTAIHLAMRGITEWIQQFPDQSCQPALIREYNRRILQDYQEIRDFIVLHYAATQREDSELWRYCKNMQWPESLREKVDYFQALGSVPQTISPLFEGTSWRSLCEGMGIRPPGYSLFIEAMDYKTIRQHMLSYKKHLQEMVAKLPTHAEFIKQHCAADFRS